MGLDRVRAVLARLDVAIACPVVTVTGTNGKGSTCGDDRGDAARRRLAHRALHVAASDALQRARSHRGARGDRRRAGRCVRRGRGRAHERRAAGAAHLLRVRHARGARGCSRERSPMCSCSRWAWAGASTPSTSIDADVAVVTSVDLDHLDFLGADARGDRPREGGHLPRGTRRRVRGPDPPQSLIDACAARSARVSAWRAATSPRPPRARSGATADRAASASDCRIRRCAAPTSSATRRPRSRRSMRCATGLPVSAGALRDGLVGVELPGRFQVLPGRPTRRARRRAQSACGARACSRASRRWATTRRPTPCSACSRTRTSTASSPRCAARVDRWTVAPLPGPRGASAQRLADALARAGVPPRRCAPRPTRGRVAGGGRRGGRG